jgi:hypothetical protein
MFQRLQHLSLILPRNEVHHMRQIVHVAQAAIRSQSGPPLIVRDHRGAERASEVELVTPAGEILGRFIYSPDKPLSCGARVWLSLDTDKLIARPV